MAANKRPARRLHRHCSFPDDHRSPANLDPRHVLTHHLDLRVDVAGPLHQHALENLDRAGAFRGHEAVLHHEAGRRAGRRSGAGIFVAACTQQTRVGGRGV
jgi:hypothetical protein